MNKSQLKKEVDSIIEMAGDDEAAHSNEDILHLALIEEFCPKWVQKEVERLENANFNRWCA